MQYQVTAPDGTDHIIEGPEGASPDDVIAQAQKLIPQQPAANTDTSGEFSKGISRGIDEGKAIVEEGIPALAKGISNKYLGTNFDNQTNLQNFQQDIQNSNTANPAAVPSVADIGKHNGVLSDLTDYAVGALGEQIPGLVVGGVGSAIGATIAKRGLTDLAEDAVGKALTDEAKQAVINRGAALGAVATIAPQTIPQTYMDFLSKGKDDPAGAIAFGALQTGLQTMGVETMISKMLGPKLGAEVTANGIMRAMGHGAATFGGIGAASAGVDLLADHYIDSNKDIFTQENLIHVLDSGLKGAIGGAAFGAVTHGVEKLGSPRSLEFGKSDLTDEQKANTPDLETEQSSGGNPNTGLVQPPKETLDTTVINPVNIPKEALDQATQMGINKESLVGKSPNELQAIATAIEKVKDPLQTTGRDVTYGTTSRGESIQKGVELAKAIQANKERLKAIEEGKRTDPNFQPGDGEIVSGAPISQDSSLGNPLVKVKIDDSNAIAEATAPTKPYKKSLAMLNGQETHAFKIGGKWLVGGDFPQAGDKVSILAKRNGKYGDGDLAWHQLKGNRLTYEDNATPEEIQKHDALNQIKTPDEPKGDIVNTPSYGNLNDDHIVPKLIDNNLHATGLDPTHEVQTKPLKDVIQRVVKEMTGDFGRSEFYKKLFLTDKFGKMDAARGVQVYQMARFAFDHISSIPQAINTAAHEAYHILEENGFFPENYIKIMDKNIDKLKAYADQHDWLSGFDFDRAMQDPDMRKEYRANAFGQFAEDMHRKSEMPKDLPYMFKKPFREALNLLEKVSNGLKGLGYKSFNDILKEGTEGKLIPSEDQILKKMDEIRDIQNQARADRMQATRQRLDNQAKAEDFNKIVDEAKGTTNKILDNSGKQLGYGARWLSSLKDLGHKYPLAGLLWERTNARSIRARDFNNQYLDALGDVQSMDKGQRYKLFELRDKLNQLGQKGKIVDGKLTWEENGQVMSLKDPDGTLSRQYGQIGKAFDLVLDHHADLIKDKHMNDKDLAQIFQKKENINTATVGKALAGLNKDAHPELHSKLTNLYDVLDNYNRMKTVDFVPNMRFGRYGIVVKDKEGNQVAFHTIEKGSFKERYNPDDLKRVSESLKKNYSDTKKYDVIGDGVHTNFEPENLKPFTMTYDKLRNQIDPRYINMDMLSSLLHSAGTDPEALDQMKNEMYNDIINKGFKKRFKEGKGIDGYSKDWDRVTNAYLTGASHWLSGVQYKEELGPITKAVAGISDESLQNRMTDFVKYTNSPQEDYQNIRRMNYWWAMDGNLSSTLVQAMTLPTVTLGKMMGYDPNLVRNMGRIGKWTKVFWQLANKGSYIENGMFKVNYDKVLDSHVSNGTLNQGQANFIKKLNDFGNIRAMMTLQGLGENASSAEKAAHKWNTISNYLSIPLASMEQTTRFATAMAAHEMFETNPRAVENAKNMLKDDGVFQAMLQNRKNMTFNENASMFLLDEAHGVYGREGRPDYQKGAGGAFFFPFMTYPHAALEGLVRDGFYRGANGKRAMAATLGAFFVTSGLMGVPGMGLAKDVMEKLQEEITGHHVDYDLFAREKLYQATGSVKFAKFITQGFLRTFVGASMGSRISLPVPGQDIISAMLGGNLKGSELFGVEGSIMAGLGNAWNAYQQGDTPTTIGAAMLPNGVANLLKTYNYSQEGVHTMSEGNNTQLLTPEQVSKQSLITRAMGITSDQIATARDAWSVINDKPYKVALDRFRKQAENIATARERARANGDFSTVKDKDSDMLTLTKKLTAYATEHKIPIDSGSFVKSVSGSVGQRLYPQYPNIDRVDKSVRPYLIEHLKALGINNIIKEDNK